MARKKDYYSFEEVLADLHLEEEELKRLVSAGEIRAFREKDTMRFKAADIERLKASTAPGLGTEAEELDLAPDELDLDLGEGAGSAEEELVLEDSPAPRGAGRVVEEVDLSASTEAAAAPMRRVPRGQSAGAPAGEEAKDSAGLLFALGVGFVLLVLANFAALGAVDGTTNALTRFLANMFA